jgi:hypothetical protein
LLKPNNDYLARLPIMSEFILSFYLLLLFFSVSVRGLAFRQPFDYISAFETFGGRYAELRMLERGLKADFHHQFLSTR